MNSNTWGLDTEGSEPETAVAPFCRVASLPDDKDVPSFHLFYRALAPHGIVKIPGASYDLRWFAERRHLVDWVHIHQVQYYYVNRSLRLTVEGALQLIGFLARLRLMGFRLAWICHNLFPHESRSRAVDYAVRIAMTRLAHLVIVHSQAARRLVGRYFLRQRGVVQAPPGHFVGWYPDTGSPEAARRRLGLPTGATVYLFFGQIRPYKGVEGLIDSFRTLPDTGTALLIAGRPLDRAYGEALQARIGDDQRIRAHLDRVPDAEVDTYFKAADLAVFPFRRILNSGSTMLALSLGVPVLVPPVPSVTEFLNNRVAYVMGRRESLTHALAEAKTRLVRGEIERGSPVVAWAGGFDWTRAVEPLLSHFCPRQRALS